MTIRNWLVTFFIGFCCIILAAGKVAADDQNWSPDVTISTFAEFSSVLRFKNSTRVLVVDNEELLISDNSGKNWEKSDLKLDSDITNLEDFEYFPNIAMILTNKKRMFYTFDQANTWNYFDVPIKSEIYNVNVIINYANENYMLFEFSFNGKYGFTKQTFYSDDGLKTPPKPIEMNGSISCTFTKINPYFTEGNDEHIVCIQGEKDVYDIFSSNRIISTDDFFKTIDEPENLVLENLHIMSLNVYGSFVVLEVNSDRYIFGSYFLYTSKDGINFSKAYFEAQTIGWTFRIIDSKNGLLHVAVGEAGRSTLPYKTPIDFYRSDSEGKYFKKIFGNLMSNAFDTPVKKLSNFDGVWIASYAENFTVSGFEPPNIKTMITFDDGENWTYLNITDSENCNNNDECSLHISEMGNIDERGVLFSSDTPGILIAKGNVGKYLNTLFSGDFNTFISKDGGLSWKKVNDNPCFAICGDLGNLLVLLPEPRGYQNGERRTSTDHFSYSIDQGETWFDFSLDSEIEMGWAYAYNMNTDKSFVFGSSNFKAKTYDVLSIDFSNAFDRKCDKSDMEEWYARIDPITKEQVCVYGHSEKVLKRKSDSKCFVDQPLKVIEQSCACTVKDYECNFGFAIDKNGECQPVLDVLSQYCKSDKQTLKLTKHRLIPGDLCENGYQPPNNDYTLKCKTANEAKERNLVKVKYTPFDENIIYYQYLNKDPKTTSFQEETLFILTESRNVYVSFNGGDTYTLFSDETFIQIIFNPYWPDSVYLISYTGVIYSSVDRGRTFSTTACPHFSAKYSSYDMAFDSKDQMVYILFSKENCDSPNGCVVYTSITKDNGENFENLLDDVNECIFAESVFDPENFHIPDTQIICSQKVAGESHFRLLSTTDMFKSESKTLFEKIIGFTISGKFLVVAQLNDDGTLTAYVSVNGETFAGVQLPYNLHLEKQSAYTVLDVNVDELFMHLTTYDAASHEFGALLKANFNGTLFTTSIDYVNRNSDAFVDFENIQSLEGLSIVNVVMNPDEVKNGDEKILISKISHNDAATWSLIPAPVKDSKGNNVNCKGCSLHLHSYTERLDPMRDSFSSSSAIGMLFGLGNVGLSLSNFNDDENIALYFSNDAGITWKEIAKGHYIWEFGDQGTVLVIVQTLVEIDTLQYSLDLGETWIDYQFSTEKKYIVEDIITVPSDNSLKFILIVKETPTAKGIFLVDFTNVYSRQCSLTFDTNQSIGDDYEYFTPKHPSLKDSCLFGHKTKYLRRKPEKQCFVGRSPLQLGTKVVSNCKCTREDYECDYNYELSIDGTCKLIKGLESLKGDAVCQNIFDDDWWKSGYRFVDEWWEPTGYRKLGMSTCQGGLILDKWKSHPCPGFHGDKRIRGWSLFSVIFFPSLAFFGALFVIYQRGIKRKGGFRRLGEIRLDQDDNFQIIDNNNMDAVINKIVEFGVFSYHSMWKFWIFGSDLIGRIMNRGRNSETNTGSIGAFFNSMDDGDNDSLFDGMNEDEDAREINYVDDAEDELI